MNIYRFGEENNLVNEARTVATLTDWTNTKRDANLEKWVKLLRDMADCIECLAGSVEHYQERVDMLEKRLFEAEKKEDGRIPLD